MSNEVQAETGGAKRTPAQNFGTILEKAFKYPWKHRALWFYGVLLTLTGAGSSFYQSNYSGNESDLAKTFGGITPEGTTIIVVLALVVIALAVIALIVSSWSLAAIIKGTMMIEGGKEITRKEIGKTGKAAVWGLIKLNFFLPFLIFFGLIVGALLLALLATVVPQPAGATVGIVLGVLALLALIPVLVYFGQVWNMASRFVVVEGMKTFAAISASMDLLKGNFWVTFGYTLVSGMIAGFGGCLGGILFFLSLFGAIALAVAKMYVAAIIVGVLTLGGFGVMLAVSGYFQAFIQSGITLWWQNLKKPE